jgi:ribosome-associated translation inhibitor RaiA
MSFPVQITYRGVDSSSALDRLIRIEAAKLDKFFDRVVSCRVLVERQYGHHHTRSPFQVHLNIVIPGADLAIMTEPNMGAAPVDAAATVRDAFRRARRRLQEYAQKKTRARTERKHR